MEHQEQTKKLMKGYDHGELDSINLSNLELYKHQSESYGQSLRKIFFTCLKELPREFVIKALKDKKIIQQDYDQKGEKYVERKETSSVQIASQNLNKIKGVKK